MKKRMTLAIEPLNRDTNLMVAGGLIALGEVFEERDFSTLKENGKIYPRWECPYNVVRALVDARKNNAQVRFKIWIKNGPKSFSEGEFLFKKRKNPQA